MKKRPMKRSGRSYGNRIAMGAVAIAFMQPAFASDFSTGPVIKAYGPVVSVEQSRPLSGSEEFKVAFDATDSGGQESPNRKFVSLARFINMQALAGVPPEQIDLALVVHGKAGFDLLNARAYQAKYSAENPNAELLAELQKQGVRVIICGQSAAYQGIAAGDLLPGVELAVSAMTAHALLQQAGYTVNPF